MSSIEKKTITTYFDGYKLGSAQRKFLWIAALAYACDMMDNVIFSFVSPVLISDYGLSLERLSQVNSLFFIGMFLGGLFGGWYADRRGRKKCLLLCLGIFSAASIMNACWMPEFIVLLEISRFFTGFGILGMTVISMSYIAEMMPSETRGKYQAITLSTGTIMIPVVSFLGSFVISSSDFGWRLLLLIGGIGIFLVPLGVKWLEESPRWLISKGRVEEAEATMERILGFPVDMTEAHEEYVKTAGAAKKYSALEVIRRMFAKTQVKQTIVIFLVCVGIAVGNNFLAAYNATFMVDRGFDLTPILLVTAVASIGQPVGEFVSGFFSDMGGRILPILGYCVLTAGALLVIGASDTVFLYGVGSFMRAFFAAGAMALMYTYLAESFSTDIRGQATGIIFSSIRLILAASTLAVPALYAMSGWFGVNAVNAGLFLFTAVVVVLFGRKTAKRSLESLHSTENGE